ncbi:MAG: hypothetical protein KatS3mg094_182 [Candidatus Parcubacteria bacterium]|nr:MAG: hypothetical protein KatS3mg094_182 [Candidatus Parcubacteria bacterium]
MKTEIVPAINAQNFEEIKEKINLLKSLTHHFHLDVASKEATNFETWNNSSELKKIPIDIEIDIHLMIYLKPNDVYKWNNENIKRFIIHPEFCFNLDAILKQIKRIKKEIYLSWSPNFEFEFIEKYLSHINGVLILGVKPGKSGQKFLESTYERIEKFNRLKQSKALKLMIDGGINRENFLKIYHYKPNFIIIASSIYSSANPIEAYNGFKNLLRQ